MADDMQPIDQVASAPEAQSEVLKRAAEIEKELNAKNPEAKTQPVQPTAQVATATTVPTQLKTGNEPRPNRYEKQAELSNIEKEARLPYIKEKAEAEAALASLKLAQEKNKIALAAKQAEEQQRFDTSKVGRETKKKQDEAKLELATAQAAQAKIAAKQAEKIANPGVIAEAKKALASNLPELSPEGQRELLTPAQPVPIPQAPPSYANLGTTEIKERTNPQTGQPEYYVIDRGVTQAKQIGGTISTNGTITPAAEILTAVGGTGNKAFENQVRNNSDSILTAVGGTTPYPTAPNPVDVAKAALPEYLPENPKGVENIIDQHLAHDIAPAPKPVQVVVPPAQVKVVQVPAVPQVRPVPVKQTVVKTVQPIKAKPIAMVPRMAKMRKVHHGRLGRPRAVGRVSRKALRERERRARIKAEKEQLRG